MYLSGFVRMHLRILNRPSLGQERLTHIIGIILAEGVALELFVEKEALQVGMAFEFNSVKVPDLPLEPVGDGPKMSQRRRPLAVSYLNFNPKTVVMHYRAEMINQVESDGTLFKPVHSGQIHKKVEGVVRRSLNPHYELDQLIGGDFDDGVPFVHAAGETKGWKIGWKTGGKFFGGHSGSYYYDALANEVISCISHSRGRVCL